MTMSILKEEHIQRLWHLIDRVGFKEMGAVCGVSAQYIQRASVDHEMPVKVAQAIIDALPEAERRYGQLAATEKYYGRYRPWFCERPVKPKKEDHISDEAANKIKLLIHYHGLETAADALGLSHVDTRKASLGYNSVYVFKRDMLEAIDRRLQLPYVQELLANPPQPKPKPEPSKHATDFDPFQDDWPEPPPD